MKKLVWVFAGAACGASIAFVVHALYDLSATKAALVAFVCTLGVFHACLVWKILGQNSGDADAHTVLSDKPATSRTHSRARVQQETAVEHEEHPFTRFIGVLVAAGALIIALGVVYYFYELIWNANVLDLNLAPSGKKIPPESYPVLLLTLWSGSQRAMAHMRPKEGHLGQGIWWVDTITSLAMVVFFIVAFVKSVTTGSGISFLLVLIAFLFSAIIDLVFNGMRRYGVDEGVLAHSVPISSSGSWRGGLSIGRVGRDFKIYPCPPGSTVRVVLEDEGVTGVTVVPPAEPASHPDTSAVPAPGDHASGARS